MGMIKKIIKYFKCNKLKKRLKFYGKNVDICHLNSKFIKPENIIIGNFVKIGENAYIDGSGGIEIGECSIIGPKISIITSNHQYENSDFLPYNNIMIRKKVIIDSYVWIGRDVIILPGVKIGKASVIAAGSVVTKDIDSYSIAGGNPAKIIKIRNKKLADKLIKEKKCVSNPFCNTNDKKIWS